jgi:hypothetical protein
MLGRGSQDAPVAGVRRLVDVRIPIGVIPVDITFPG